MQAWWVSFASGDAIDYQLQNSLGIYVALIHDSHGLNWTIHDKSDSFKEALTVEQAKEIVAKKFAVMLCELATTVLTTEG